MTEGTDNTTPNGESRDDDVFDGLTAQQQKAIIALLENPTVVKAAEASSVSERTLRRWMSDPIFSKAFRKARRESFSHAISIGAHYAAHAMQTLGMVMTDRTVAAQSRVSAANAILKFGRDSIELDDLAARVEALERLAEQEGQR